MNVAVGYYCDPDGLEGLAHFLGTSLVVSFLQVLFVDVKISSAGIYILIKV